MEQETWQCSVLKAKRIAIWINKEKNPDLAAGPQHAHHWKLDYIRVDSWYTRNRIKASRQKLAFESIYGNDQQPNMYLTLKFTVKVVQDRMIVVSVVTRVEFDENKSSQNDKQKEHTVVGLRVCSLQVKSSTPRSHKKRPLTVLFQWNAWSTVGCSVNAQPQAHTLAVSGTSWTTGVCGLFSTLRKRNLLSFMVMPRGCLTPRGPGSSFF